MLKIAVSGTTGRMGQLVLQAIKEDKETMATLLLDHKNSQEPVFQPKTFDVFIDFSSPEATMHYVSWAVKYGFPMVIATTGLNQDEKQKIENAAQDLPILFSPNMSIGMNITYGLLEWMATHFQEKPDVAIIDLHHKNKKDQPSGTALNMKNILLQGFPEIAMSSLRLGDVVGEHTALFLLPGEQIEITHRAYNRMLYAKGALKAAKWLVSQKPGLYTMENVK